MALKSKLSSRLCSFMILVFCINLVILTPFEALANGAAGVPSILGNEIAILEKKANTTFIVDEEVVINGWTSKVDVKYVITNPSDRADEFTMIFPVEGNGSMIAQRFDIDNIYEKLSLNFEASLNGNQLPVQQIDPEDVSLEGEYKKFEDSACCLVAFKVRILPGVNIIAIQYRLIADGMYYDGGVGTWAYNYSIWPAKNWVAKFRNALWRVILPKSVQGTILPTQKDGEWFTDDARRLENTYKISVSISAPGTRHDYADHIDFEAHDFIPSGQISLGVAPRPLKYDVPFCDDEMSGCDLTSLKALLKIRPYIGNRRCYDLSDLNVIPEGDMGGFRYSQSALPFLRNEIFARKGYLFKTEFYNKFFSDMPWYKTSDKNIVLNNIEKWNVDLLKAVEDNIKSSDDRKNLTAVYERLKDTCPMTSHK